MGFPSTLVAKKLTLLFSQAGERRAGKGSTKHLRNSSKGKSWGCGVSVLLSARVCILPSVNISLISARRDLSPFIFQVFSLYKS